MPHVERHDCVRSAVKCETKNVIVARVTRAWTTVLVEIYFYGNVEKRRKQVFREIKSQARSLPVRDALKKRLIFECQRNGQQ